MKKPWYLMPFIFVYRIFRYFFIGLTLPFILLKSKRKDKKDFNEEIVDPIEKLIKEETIINANDTENYQNEEIKDEIIEPNKPKEKNKFYLFPFIFIYRIFKYLVIGLFLPFILIFRKKDKNKSIKNNDEVVNHVDDSIELETEREQNVETIDSSSIVETTIPNEVDNINIETDTLIEQENQAEQITEPVIVDYSEQNLAGDSKFMNENIDIDSYIESINKKEGPLKVSDHINNFLEKYIKTPIENLNQKYNKWYKNSKGVKKKEDEVNKRADALIEEIRNDRSKSMQKVVFEYEVEDKDGKILKNHFEANSKAEIYTFLTSQGFRVINIKTNKYIQFMYGKASSSKVKIKNKDLIFFLTQLSTYLKAGLTLVDSLSILTHQFSKKSYQRIIRTILYDLTMGQNLSAAMEKQGAAFPRLLISMVKGAELTGELPETLDNMAEYYNETEKTKKQMLTALTYPAIVFVVSIAVITFIMIYVIPRFVTIYDTMENAEIPAFTKFIISTSNYLQNNIFIILVIIAIIIAVFVYMYNNVKLFRASIQRIIMKIPGFRNIIIYNEVGVFTKTFATLLSHNVYITDVMEILDKITNNEIYRGIVAETIKNLGKGDKISTAFKHWAFPLPAYEMIVTGEKTGQLAEMMDKVSIYYQDLHRTAVTRIKSYIEPVLIIFLTATVGVIVLAIVIPMFDIYSSVQ